MIKYLLNQLARWGLFVILLSACGPVPPSMWVWQRAETGLPRQAIFTTIAVDPADNNRLWAGYYGPGGLASSQDGGQTWQTTPSDFADNPVFDLFVEPAALGQDATTVWAASRDGLLYSRDGSASWQRVETDLSERTAFALAADDIGQLYVGWDGAGVYQRTAPEQAWQSLTTGFEDLATAAVLSLAVSGDGQIIYAGTSGRGVFATSDGGQLWQSAYSGDYVPNVALNPNRPTQAVVSLRDRLLRTTDGGQSWQVLAAASFGWEEIVSLLWLADGTLVAGTGQSRLYVSLDQGESWFERSSLAAWGVIDLTVVDGAVDPLQILAGTWGGLYRSDDGGLSWQNLASSAGVGSPNVRTLLSVAEGPLLGGQMGLFLWDAPTARWVPVSANLPPGGINVLRRDPSHPQVIYAGTSGNGLYRSDDGGARWQQVSASTLGITNLVIDPTQADHLYMLAAWERAYESWDGGQSWQARWTGFGDTLETTSLVIDSETSGRPTTYVGAEWGLYRSQGNEPWEIVGLDIVDQSILTLSSQPNPPALGGGSLLYIGATRGAYRSSDGGRTVRGCVTGEGWGCGLEDISVTAFLFDPVDSQQLYAGTAYHGVYASTDGGQHWQTIGPAELDNELVEALAWGPAGELFVAAAGGVWRGVRP
jgi:photosystem II stability/assembly factor-like uncharacterized protein